MREEPQLGAEPSSKTHEDYTVGWICALSLELTAATAMLDVKHPDLKVPPTDQNVYSLGSIGEHNIVIATLPTIGTSNAAAVAAQMILTFPNVKFGLMVGIGAGIPPKVRLGDVVVSRPSDTYPGVVQWDYGKATADGFRRTGSLNNPPNFLLAALKKLETENETHGSKIPQYLQQLKQRYPRLASQYLRSETLEDIAFKSDAPHIDKTTAIAQGLLVSQEDEDEEEEEDGEEKTCEFCDKKKTFKPSKREMLVHFGLIASGNQVIKDAKVRNQLKKEFTNLLCIEMEAAGLMDLFPCLVIRGICDYADAHKNKDWQKPAAAVAAAFTKELLMYIHGHQVDREPPIREVLHQFRDDVSEIVNYTRAAKANWDLTENRQILSWLTDTDYGLIHADKINQKHPGTGEWFLKSTQFQEWCHGEIQTLFCPGRPGAGKTVITATAISQLLAEYGNDENIGIAYIYFNYKPLEPPKLDNLLAGLSKQLIQKLSHVPDEVKELYERHKRNGTRPTIDEYQKTLQSIASSFTKTFILVDALDECDLSCREKFLSEIFRFKDEAGANQIAVKIFATSRFIPDIERHFAETSTLEISGNEDDMQNYMQDNLPCLRGFLNANLELWEEVKYETIKAAEGIFLLVKLQLEALGQVCTKNEIRAALKRGQGTGSIYYDAYDKIMARIRVLPNGAYEHVINILSWIIGSKRPLSRLELQHALAIKPGQYEIDEDDLPDLETLRSFCCGLVTIDRQTDVVRLVHYTAQEYFMDPEKQQKWLPSLETRLAESCVTYLKYKNFQTGACSKKSDFKARLKVNPLFEYAAVYWGHHVREAGIGGDQLVSSLLKSEALITACSQGLFSLWHWSGFDFHTLSWTHLCAFYGLETAIALNLLEEQRLSKGTDWESKDSKYGRTPLIWAARYGRTAVVELLINKRADLEVKDNSGQAPLSTAAEYAHMAVVDLLINKGADLEAKDDDGRTPLSWVAIYGRTTVVELLINKGADLEAKDNNGRTPLSWAAMYGHTAIVELLINKGAYLEAKDNYGQTPLSSAAEYGHTALVELLINKGADLEAKDYDGQTPLSLAVQYEHTAIVELLINKGAYLEAKDNYGQTPLSSAAEYGHTAVIKLLINKGADLEAKDYDGQTPLSLAVQYGHTAIVELLINKGADLEAKDYDGQTPLSLAVKYEHTNLVDLSVFKIPSTLPRLITNFLIQTLFGGDSASMTSSTKSTSLDTMPRLLDDSDRG